MKYFHQLSESDRIEASNLTVAQILNQYTQPDWCKYPDALAGCMGCWSLVGGIVKDEICCKGCEWCKSEIF